MEFNSEVRPRRELMNPNFEGYKLSLRNVPTEKTELEHPVAVFTTRQSDIAYLTLSLYAQHSLLFVDRWTSALYWFSQPNEETFELVTFNPNTSETSSLLKLPIPDIHALPTIHFPVSNGQKRNFARRFCKTRKIKICKAVLVNDVKIDEEKGVIYVAASFIRGKQAIVVLARFDKDGKFIAADEFKGGAICSFVAISSDFAITFISDKLYRHKCDEKSPEPKKILYKWRQNLNDVVLFFEFDHKVDKSEVNVSVRRNHLEIAIRNVKLEGELFQAVDPDQSSWEISPGGVEVTLEKAVERGWSQVYKDFDFGDEVFNKEFVDQVKGRLGHLTTESAIPEEAEKPGVDCNQYEDIDRETEFERSIFRFKDGDWTHKASLSANLPLFWNFITPTEKAIAMRHDVDACLWSSNSSDERVPLGHVGTFDAVGYIHAGKQNLAFINAPPNNGYVCICEQKRRILLYKHENLETNLRHRGSGRKVNEIGRQQVVKIDDDEAFLGLQCNDDALYLLTKNSLWRVIPDDVEN
ncbi:unnamed protein product [Oikopleura dioica]|uniref:NudC domain-containing protein 1 n=1 Tax=Oikopleura dioica TaxID=34765 RepID=E4YTZ0_OIKDI|nr:unnamed protein product [Oikopleura dioica]